MSVLAAAVLVSGMSIVDKCEQAGELAETIMRVRQAGVPISTTMKTGDDGLFRKMVLIAYQIDRYRRASEQQIVIDAFKEAIELACFKAAETTNGNAQ